MMDIQLTEVSKTYGRHHALGPVNLRAGPGVLGLLGPNGAGKTTLLRIMATVIAPTAGRVELLGHDCALLAGRTEVRRRLGYVPQGREIFPRLTVEENIIMALAMHKDHDGIPDDIFQMFPVLKQMLRRRGGDLSGGQQQQLAIARALVMKPKVLILDEPTEGIQPSIIKDIERVIRMLSQRGDMAILLVEQYFEFARELADQYLILRRGEIVKRGAQSEMDADELRSYLVA